MDTQVEIARHVAPEDIAMGDYVTVAHVTYEFVGDCSSVPEQTVTPKRVTFMSPCAGRPLRVMSICLPTSSCASRKAVTICSTCAGTAS